MSSADPLENVFEHRERTRKPGWRKALPWLAVVGVVAVGVALLIIFVSNTGTSTSTPISNAPVIDAATTPKTVKLDPQAEVVARRFIETAVARKNLREAYTLAGPEILQGETLKQWLTGDIAVVPYPVSDIGFAPMKVDYSHKNDALIEIALLPKKGSSAKSLLFTMELSKLHGKWVVQSWVPSSSPPVPRGRE